MLESQGRQGGVGHERATHLSFNHQPPQKGPESLAAIDDRDIRALEPASGNATGLFAC